ncbi:MAG: hypothetical protein JOZ24_09565 [Candidatus Eremiobacteraeota bacterium]|nr:hypothetical protein [Candidatus Eremiobacteraeota bacterium]
MRAVWWALAFVAVALPWGYGAHVLGEALGLPGPLAPLSTLLLLAAYVLPRRDRELSALLPPAFAIAYAAFVGLALARVPHLTFDIAFGYGSGGFSLLEPLSEPWPLILLSGAVFALIAIVLVGVPLATLPRRSSADPRAHDAFWALVAQHNGAAIEKG